VGNPTYITVVTTQSSLSSPWFSVNWQANPINIGLAVISGSTNWRVDVTMDDPFGTFPSSAGPTVFTSTALGGGIAAGSTAGGIGSITTPIAALRLTVVSSGTATMTVLQSGMN
jgi:hypothetical protein